MDTFGALDIATAKSLSSGEEDGSGGYSDGDGTRDSASPSRLGGLSGKRKRRQSSTTDRSRIRPKNTEMDGRDGDVTGTAPSGGTARIAEGEGSVASPSSSLARPRRRKTRDVVEKTLISEAQAEKLYKKCVKARSSLRFLHRLTPVGSLPATSPGVIGYWFVFHTCGTSLETN